MTSPRPRRLQKSRAKHVVNRKQQALCCNILIREEVKRQQQYAVNNSWQQLTVLKISLPRRHKLSSMPHNNNSDINTINNIWVLIINNIIIVYITLLYYMMLWYKPQTLSRKVCFVFVQTCSYSTEMNKQVFGLNSFYGKYYSNFLRKSETYSDSENEWKLHGVPSLKKKENNKRK